MDKIAIIVNGKASRAARYKALLHASFIEGENGCVYFAYVNNPKELEKHFKKALNTKPDILTFGGGDGTVIAGVEYALKDGYKGDFGILPLGTSNYLARNLKIPIAIPLAVRLLRKKRTRRIYLANANGYLFSLMTTIGVATAVSEHVDVHDKKRLGQAAYVREAFRQLKTHESFEYEVKAEGQKTLTGVAHQLTIINADLGRQIQILPGSDIEKPLLTVTIHDSKDNKFLLFMSVAIYVLTIGRIKRDMITFETSKVEVKTKPKMSFAVDGEVYKSTPVVVQQHPDRINFRC